MASTTPTPKTPQTANPSIPSKRETFLSTTEIEMVLITDHFRALSLSDQKLDTAGIHLELARGEDEDRETGPPRDDASHALQKRHGTQYVRAAAHEHTPFLAPALPVNAPDALNRYLSTPDRSEAFRLGLAAAGAHGKPGACA